MMNAATNRSREEQRALGIAAEGRVQRDDDGFTVYATGIAPEAFRVWDDPHVGVRCTCERFDAAIVRDEAYRCEHMLAVTLAFGPPDEFVERACAMRASGSERLAG